MPPSLGLLYLQALKTTAALAATAVLAFFASLGPSVWADPPSPLRLGGAPPDGADAVALFRAAAAKHGDTREKEVAARVALKTRFPLGSDAAALVAFLTAEGPDRSVSCERNVCEVGRRRYYCRIHYGSLAASVLGLDRWRAGEWVVGAALAADSEAIERISVHVPFFGKG